MVAVGAPIHDSIAGNSPATACFAEQRADHDHSHDDITCKSFERFGNGVAHHGLDRRAGYLEPVDDPSGARARLNEGISDRVTESSIGVEWRDYGPGECEVWGPMR